MGTIETGDRGRTHESRGEETQTQPNRPAEIAEHGHLQVEAGVKSLNRGDLLDSLREERRRPPVNGQPVADPTITAEHAVAAAMAINGFPIHAIITPGELLNATAERPVSEQPSRRESGSGEAVEPEQRRSESRPPNEQPVDEEQPVERDGNLRRE